SCCRQADYTSLRRPCGCNPGSPGAGQPHYLRRCHFTEHQIEPRLAGHASHTPRGRLSVTVTPKKGAHMAMPTYEHELESLHELELEGEGELETEMEGEGELELEGEGEVSPVQKIYADAMMEHLAHMAAEAESEQEAAEHF